MRKLTLALLLLASSAQAGQQEVADSLKAIDREIVRFRWFASDLPGLSFMNVGGTLPTTNTADVYGARFVITSAGSSAFRQFGFQTALGSGYSGNSATSAGVFFSDTAGGANNAYSALGNIALIASTNGVKANATNIGTHSFADNLGAGASVYGSVSIAHNAGAGGLTLGAMGLASNTPAGGIRVGGYFGFDAATPTFVSAALIADNLTVSAPIFLGRDNGTIKYTLADGGDITLGDTAGIASPASHNISGEPGLGTDIAGGSVTIHGGIGTGAGATSAFTIRLPEAGASSSTAQTEITAFDRNQKSYAMADNVTTPIFTVTLATDDTGCGMVVNFNYTVTDGTNTNSHSGTVVYALTNNNGTVTGTANDAAEAVDGTGCAGGCDTHTVSAVGTTATINMRFNNTLSQTGALRYGLMTNTCQGFTRQ